VSDITVESFLPFFGAFFVAISSSYELKRGGDHSAAPH
jgi:hypothetical protein